MSSDAYIRIGSRGVRAFGQTEHHDSLIFVDVPPGCELAALRQASYGLFSNAETLLLREGSPVDSTFQQAKSAGPDDRFDQLEAQIKALKLDHVHRGLLHQPVGEPAWIEGRVEDEALILERARAVELEALLDWGEAVWRPNTYHYRLPSGEHAAGFVRVADAISHPRDAEVLASWMHDRLADGVGIVVDTGTLSGMVQALLAAVRSRHDWEAGRVNVLDGYPATAFDVARAVRETNAGNGVIGLLSVNSSGRLRGHLLDALATLPDDRPRALDVLVNKTEIEAHNQDANGVTMRTWHPRPSSKPLVSYDAENADVCQLCRNARTASLISVSPRSFDGSLPATLARVTPSVEDARRNRVLWELTDAVEGAIRLDSEPLEAVSEWRPPGPMPVVFDHERLLRIAEFREAAVAALQEELQRDRANPAHADLVLMPDHEHAMEGRAELIEAMAPILGRKLEVAPFPPRGDWSEDLRAKIRNAHDCIAVLTFGAVSGTTLHGALAAVQKSRDRGRYDLYAYVLHARLAEQRAWQTLENTYAGNVFAAWHSYLPDRSPLRDEQDTLEEISEPTENQLSKRASEFITSRTAFVSGRDANQLIGLFWGTTPETELTPNSIFGQGLHAPAVYVAVGSAMERARKDQRKEVAPVRRVFEMPAIVRSYYDPMILAAVLRWLQPHEAWWGVDVNDEGTVVKSMLARATSNDHLILLPELLLAGAQGKLNRPGIAAAQAQARSALANESLGDRQKAPIELGLALLPDYGTDDDERQQASGAQSAIRAAESPQALLKLVPDLLRDLRVGRLPPTVATELEIQITKLTDA